jgi:SAM-dependent methyltransferase
MLEVGCGMGYFLDVATRHFSVTGLDNSAAVVEVARVNAPGAAMLLGETLPEGLFDMICGFHVFEHLTDPVDFVRNCRARLRPGGILYLRLPNRESSWARVRGKDFYLKGHCSHFSPASLDRCLKLGGFKQTDISTDSFGGRWFASFTRPIWSLGSAAARPINKSAYGGHGRRKNSLVRLKQTVLSCMHAGELTTDFIMRPVWHFIAARGRGEELVVLAH